MLINLVLVAMFAILSFLIVHFDMNKPTFKPMIDHFAILIFFMLGMVQMNLGHPIFNKYASYFLIVSLILVGLAAIKLRKEHVK